ncbi:MAG TPA: peptide chain release factor 1 [Planctomycetota bacterium]|nr:peptide chain release factor 1 [Planctomycetota bacterium]
MAGNDALLRRLNEVDQRARELEAKMAEPETASNGVLYGQLAKEFASLQKTIGPYREYVAAEKQRAEAEVMAKAETDPELRAMAEEEVKALAEKAGPLLERLKDAFLAADDADADRNVIVEIRAGTGGDEASLFAADLFRMYSRYAERNRWRVEVMDANASEVGGFKEVVFAVKGDGAFRALRYESGGHRVQRVPKTETQGRIHTSMATVGVLPEAEEVDVQINPQDLRIDTMRAGGPGGQHVNKTESAIRIVHIPTGIEVRCQEGKSQHKNRAEAMRLLRTKLFQMTQERLQKERGELRRSLIGSGDRSERIRTYNFPQNRVTDHRLEMTVHDIAGTLDGDLQPLVGAMQQYDREQRLAAL